MRAADDITGTGEAEPLRHHLNAEFLVMSSKRPIDRLRESAFSMEVDGDGDDSAILEMIPMGNLLYIVKGHSIHAVQLADQIDPDRTNIAIPHTRQQILSFSGSDPVVARTFLTARTLFKKTFLGASFDEERGLKLAWELLQNIVGITETLTELESAESRARISFETQTARHRGLQLPKINGLKVRCESFAQQCGHIINVLEKIAKLFYGSEIASKWIDSLTALTKKRYGEDSPFAQYIEAARPFLLFVLGMRNMIEHPKPHKEIRIYDFRLLPSGQIAPPAVEIITPEKEMETATITSLMKKVIDDLVSVSEILMAHLCGVRVVQRSTGIPVQVVELPIEQRPNKQQRFFYGCYMGEQLCHMG